MSINLPTIFAQQFATNVQLLLQQQGSRLRPFVMSGMHVGKQASPVDQIGKVEMQDVTTKYQPIGRVDAPTARRWCVPTDHDLNQIVDTFDQLKMLTDPKSSYVQNAVHAAGRKIDSKLLAAMNGTAKTGETGSTDTVLPSGQKVVVGFGAAADTGLTVAKLREAKRLLMAANVDIDREMGALSKNTLMFQLYSQILSSKIRTMHAAIRGQT